MTRILAKSPEAEWSVERRVLTTIQTFPRRKTRSYLTEGLFVLMVVVSACAFMWRAM